MAQELISFAFTAKLETPSVHNGYSRYTTCLDTTVYHLYRTDAAHNHVELGNEPKAITDDVKKLIREFVDANTTLKYIMPLLRHNTERRFSEIQKCQSKIWLIFAYVM